VFANSFYCLQRQLYDKSCPAARISFNMDRAMVIMEDIAADCQADPLTFLMMCHILDDKLIKYPVPHMGINAFTIVLHGHGQDTVCLPAFD
jgi:hypothetical protein